ncbi:MAG: OmpH family outer membrane protein [Planctomycetota bacterium]|nr:OmpH family outer membrane protein [Planctomycetota bacterium]
MKSNTLAAFALGSAVAIAAFFAGNAEARRIPAMFAPPSAIGIVDMATVFDKLEESAEWDVKIKALEARAGEEMGRRKADLDALAKELEALSDGAEKDAKLDSLRLKRLQAEQWAGFKELEVDRETSLKWQAVYRSVREGAKKLAEAEKYDLIVVDDSRVEIRTQRAQNAPSLTQQAQSQISQLRVLYAGRTVDVTDKLIVQINNARSLKPAATAKP